MEAADRLSKSAPLWRLAIGSFVAAPRQFILAGSAVRCKAGQSMTRTHIFAHVAFGVFEVADRDAHQSPLWNRGCSLVGFTDEQIVPFVEVLGLLLIGSIGQGMQHGKA